MDYRLTIIIPHYNIPNLLERCLNSIPERHYIQIIVVDDCSSNIDECKRVIEKQSGKHIEFYSTAIGGSAGRARNVGIEHAKGKWVTFIDADDLFTSVLDKLFVANDDKDVDIMFFPSISVMSDDITKKSDRNIFDYHFEEYFRSGNESLLRYEFDAPWGKIIQKDFIEKFNIRFDEIRYSNDTIFSVKIGIFAKKIFVSDIPLYMVTTREGSLTSGKMGTIEEWRIRYSTAIRRQNLFDEHSIKHRRYSFVDSLEFVKTKDKSVFKEEFKCLSFRNKRRFYYCKLRKLIAKLR